MFLDVFGFIYIYIDAGILWSNSKRGYHPVVLLIHGAFSWGSQLRNEVWKVSGQPGPIWRGSNLQILWYGNYEAIAPSNMINMMNNGTCSIYRCWFSLRPPYIRRFSILTFDYRGVTKYLVGGFDVRKFHATTICASLQKKVWVITGGLPWLSGLPHPGSNPYHTDFHAMSAWKTSQNIFGDGCGRVSSVFLSHWEMGDFPFLASFPSCF